MIELDFMNEHEKLPGQIISAEVSGEDTSGVDEQSSGDEGSSVEVDEGESASADEGTDVLGGSDDVPLPEDAPASAPKTSAQPAAPQPTPERVSDYPWYVVHTYSGYEMRAKLNLEERIRTRNLNHKFGTILVPQETVVELVRGQKKTSKRKVFPGYILIQVDLDDETWHLVKDTPKITGFVGDSRNPSSLTKEEFENLVKQMEGGAQKPRPKVHFEEGDAVKVIDGPFADFNGTVDEVKADKGKLRVLISIFGRNTPVELDFVQVEKA